ncbi:hypothetical protein GUITHDRAFT_114416 [Guillardia theta CCMP2712]|uniref:SPRY domain-containing protein n=1 Tax=Guillardia theta (strain CCMP2712) TaxID=905079 RepID=L1IUD7_GUITC|nr:hypothetical protein GUITHDRAFT_114416 [Guillardia theta CCMP2712]EKX39455.1 hypothetical protein GUITHDRAFT_114416 [Guillardia theta CCMP2712]|eukprot:XP_005826435.1 hypothetical protein GUITHDRAFT_114416 [Guillardia theta CCMP2712]
MTAGAGMLTTLSKNSFVRGLRIPRGMSCISDACVCVEPPVSQLGKKGGSLAGKRCSLSDVSEDCMSKIMFLLDGNHILMLACTCRQFSMSAKSLHFWKCFCTRLDAFCKEDATEIGIFTNNGEDDHKDWIRLNTLLEHERNIRILRNTIEFPERVSMKCGKQSYGHLIQYVGKLGGDRAVRGAHGWTLQVNKKRWIRSVLEGTMCRLGLRKARSSILEELPPILAGCDSNVLHVQAQYIFSLCYYYEVKIREILLKNGSQPNTRKWCIAIGLSTKDFRLTGRQPGWDSNSCAYHGDDGKVYCRNKTCRSWPTFGAGDTVGCGLCQDKSIFFTLNGNFLGFLKDHILWDPRRQTLHPTIGIDSFQPLEVNWGTKPFMYNFEEVLTASNNPPS